MRFRDLHKNIQIRVITDFLTDLASMAILPFMAIYFSSQLGQGLAGILLLTSIIAAILAGFYAGFLADRIGRKKVMVYAQIVQVIALLIMTLSNSPWFDSVWLTYAMFLLSSASSGMVNPAAEAMIVDVSTKENRTFTYSLMYWSGNIAIAIGAVLGGLFFEEFRFGLFAFFTFISIVTLIMMVYFITESYHPDISGESQKTVPLKGLFNSYAEVMKDLRFMVFCLGSVLVVSLEFQLDKYIAVRLKQDIHATFLSIPVDGVKMLGFILIVNTALIVLVTLKVSKWIKRFKETTVLFTGLILYAAGYSFLAFSDILLILAVATIAFTIGELLYIPVKQTYLAELVANEARGSYMAVNGLTYDVAMISGSLGLTLGAFVPPIYMGGLFFILGMGGLLCFRFAISGFSRQAKGMNTKTNSV